MTEKPANLKVTATNATDNSFSLAWDPVPEATEYRIYYVAQGRKIGWRKWMATKPDPLTTPAAELTKIPANTAYSYRVTAIDAGGEGPPSDTVDVNLTRQFCKKTEDKFFP